MSILNHLSELAGSAAPMALAFQFLPGYRGGTPVYSVQRSLRFRKANQSYLSRTPASSGDRQKGTLSFWAKLGSLTFCNFFATASGGDPWNTAANFSIGYDTGSFILYDNSVTLRKTGALFRDPTAWYHVCVYWDTTQATAQNRMRIDVNGVEQTSFLTNNTITQNTNLLVNQTWNHFIGGQSTNVANSYLDGLLSEIVFVDGQQISGASFGQTDPLTGRWVPKKYNGTYGINGFFLNFSDKSANTAAAIGKDSSGNGNNWTPSGIDVVTAGVTNDSLVDVPSMYGTDTGAGGEVRGNYATLNPLDSGGSYSLSEANLRGVASGAAYWASRFTQSCIDKGYIECAIGGSSQDHAIGLVSPTVVISTLGGSPVSATGAWCATNAVFGSGRVHVSSNGGGSTQVTGNGAANSGDYWKMAWDITNGKLWIGSGSFGWFPATNGGTQGDPAAGTNPTMTFTAGSLMMPYIGGFGTTGFGQVNCGQRAFSGTAPTGFKALCTTNLPEPAIKLPKMHFSANTRAGTGAAFSVTGKNAGELIITKARGTTTDYAISSIVRGTGKYIVPPLATSEVSDAQAVTAFNSDGFSGGTAAIINASGQNFLDLLWKLGGAAVAGTGTGGCSSVLVSANPTAGVAVAKYSGGGANGTYTHGLNSAPKFAITKYLNTAGSGNGRPTVYHSALGTGNALYLDATLGASVDNSYQSMSSTTVGVGTNICQSGSDYEAFLFAEVAGFSRAFAVPSNASADGPYVDLGFLLGAAIIKSNSSSNWFLIDTTRGIANPIITPLYPNLTTAEGGSGAGTIDVTASGIKFRNSLDPNNSGTIYGFAWAAAPFKYANGR